ncbi:family 78 glycoside hydrolase catalytic domain [Microbacterium sp.]|uniref:family 78 glycoside hydrolase catalytic domain n=1 Tax=Microbacterium sp. TaxID=51671 RepID=UPI003A8F556F
MSEQSCRDLRLEYLSAPIGVGARVPRFSWIIDQAQDGYEIEVITGDRTVWASGRIESADTVLIEYAGEPLSSNTAYSWRVRSFADGTSTAWAESSFETALLDVSDWQAAWVEPAQEDAVVERWSIVDWIRGLGPDSPPEERLRPPQLLRHSFTAREKPVRARMYATSRGTYSAFVNGQRADDQVLAPGSDTYEHRISVQCYDITHALVVGENVIAIALADGWWAGRLGLTGSSAQFGTRLSAIWQLHLDYVDGTSEVVASGPDVRSASGPWAYADLFVGEQFDRRAVPEGWDRPGFDDSRWAPVTQLTGGYEVLRPFSGEPIRRVLELPAQQLIETADGVIVDFGQVIAGRVRVRLHSTTPGQRITIEHTETLASDGSWFANIVGINKEQTDVFIAAGGDDEWEPEFTFHGFRYARVSGLTEPLDPDDIVAVVLASDLEQTGLFETSDARLNRLHQNVVWSQRGNFISVPMDCPQREKVGWAGDIQAFVAAATNNAQVVPFLSRWLENLRADQLDDGRIPIFSPRSPFDSEAAANAQGVGAIVASAGWSDAIATVPWTLYERYGDRRILEDNFEAAVHWVDFQRTAAAAELPHALNDDDLDDDRRRRQALLFNTGAHFGDWLTPSTMEGKPTHEAIGIAPALTSEFVAPMFQANTLSIVAEMAAVLGKEADAAAFAVHAADVRAAFAAEYIDAEGDLPLRLQGVYVLALAFDMVPASRREYTAARLVELIEQRGDRLDTGFLSTPYLLDVLCDTGHADVAHRLLWQHEMPSWLYEVDHDATTIWESWDAIAPDGTIRPMSFNHYAPGSVDDWLYRRVAGIRSTSPGYRSATLAPDFDSGVDSARAQVGTPFGPLRVEWTKSVDAASVTADVPYGIDAVLRGPTGDTIPLLPGRSTHILNVFTEIT